MRRNDKREPGKVEFVKRKSGKRQYYVFHNSTLNGKRVSVRVYGDTEEEARKEWYRRELELEKQIPIAERNVLEVTFGDVMDNVMQKRKKRLEESTYAKKENKVDRYIIPKAGSLSFKGGDIFFPDNAKFTRDKLIKDITALDLDNWMNFMDELNDRRYFGVEYKQKIVSLMRLALYDIVVLHRHGELTQAIIDTYVPKKVEGKDSNAKKQTIWEYKDFRKYIDKFSTKRGLVEHRTYLISNILWFTMIRIGELQAIKLGKITSDSIFIDLSVNKDRVSGGQIITTPKTKESIRNVPIYSPLYNDIIKYVQRVHELKDEKETIEFMKENKEYFLFFGQKEVSKVGGSNKKEFVPSYDVPISREPIVSAMKLYGGEKDENGKLKPNYDKKAKKKIVISPKEFRASASQYFMNKNRDLERLGAVSAILGHKNTKVTEEHYVKLGKEEDKMKAIMTAIDDYPTKS